jgi:copper chaperone CopZ
VRATIHLHNVRYAGCAQNVKTALQMIEGVKAVQVNREEQLAEVLYEAPATALQLREQLLVAGYLAKHAHGEDQ